MAPHHEQRLVGQTLFERTYPAEPATPTMARHAVTQTLRELHPAHAARVEDDLALVVSELAANAVLHARTSVTVAMSVDGDRVRVAVRDDSPLPPVRREADPHDARGRGMVIVEAVAAEWGVDASGNGKWVWADLLATDRDANSDADQVSA